MRYLAALLLVLCSSQTPAARPNVLLIYVDDLGYGDTAVYGHPVVETPNIDRLAAEGVMFSQFYSPSALCSPSRAGLLTGRTPYRTGIKSWIPDNSGVSLASNEITIAKLLKDAGYRTAVVGKWHLNGGLHIESAPQPRDFGFDYQYGLAAWVKNEKAEAAGVGRLFPDNMYRNNQPVGETNKFSGELVTDEAISWIGTVSDEAPFFLYLTYSEVHTPVASPEEYLNKYDQFLTDESRQHPWAYYMDWAGRPHRGKGEYYANISYLDSQIGRILAELEMQGQLDRTLIIFSSDNGPLTSQAEMPWEVAMAGETNGLRGKKRYLFEGGIRVPGIFRWPEQFETAVVDVPATALDIMPTLTELLGLGLPRDRVVDGESLATLLTGRSVFERKRPLFWSIPTPDGLEYAVRQGDWKLILDHAAVPVYLFDLKSDPYEITNLLEQQLETAAMLQQSFDQIRTSVSQDMANWTHDEKANQDAKQE